MKTFNQAGKDKLISILEAHAAADNIIQGSYWNKGNGKGCAVGCTLHDYGVDPGDHSQYETLFGIPRVLARLEDTIFEGLSVETSKQWPLRFVNAVPVDTDISNCFPKFMMFILTDPEHGVIKYAKTDRTLTVVQQSSDLYLDWPNIDAAAAAAAGAAGAAGAAYAAAAAAAAYAAADAADAAAADAAADAAAAAGAAAADAAADAARQRHHGIMAAKLIELLQDTANG